MLIDIHMTVRHNLYGKGEVTKITDDKVYVSFGKNQRIFPYPDAFEKEFLFIENAPESAKGIPDEADPAELAPEDIKHHIMVIKVNQRYEENMDPDALYSVVRGIWKASKKRAQKVEYAFGVYQSRIVAVYKPTEWFVCKDAQDKLPRKDIVLSEKNEDRIFFVDESYEQGNPPDDNQKFYIGKSIAKLSMNKNSQNPVSYLEPIGTSKASMVMDSNREIVLDAAGNITHTKIYEALNETVGTSYTGWMKATWPSWNSEMSFWIWFPKLAETKNGELVSAAFDCVNTISEDWNELIFDDLKDSPPEDEDSVIPPVLIFAKEPKGGPYIFRGVYLRNKEKSEHRHHVYYRIGTKVRLVGQPSEKIEILDDFRKKEGNV